MIQLHRRGRSISPEIQQVFFQLHRQVRGPDNSWVIQRDPHSGRGPVSFTALGPEDKEPLSRGAAAAATGLSVRFHSGAEACRRFCTVNVTMLQGASV